jgi:long-chain acyl-CoA synthetase
VLVNVRDTVVNAALSHREHAAMVLGDQRMTYGELDRLSNRLAHVLLDAGLQRGGHVALLMSYCPEWLVGYFGIIKAGGKAIVLNAILKPADYEHLLEDSDSSILLTEQSFADALATILPRLPKLETTIVRDGETFGRALEAAPQDMPAIELDDEEECTFVYTSGVLGRQKGVIHTHRSLMAAARLVTPGLQQTSKDVVVGMIPFFYLLGLAVVALISALEGSTIVLVQRFTTRSLLETADEEKATILVGVPAMFNALAQVDEETIGQYDISRLRLAITAGAKSSPALMAELERKYGLTLVELYGTTEAIASTMGSVTDRRLGTAGKPLQEFKLVDPDGSEVRQGEIGELVVRSPELMNGYYNAPELTARVFRDGWFHTGDLMREDGDGYLEYVEKRSFIIVTAAGVKIPPTEVEEVLLTHPAVAEAAYVGVDGPDGNQIPTLFAVLREGKNLPKTELRRFCSERLADYKVPRRIEFLDAIPKTGSGKMDRRTLKEMGLALADQ